MRVDGKKLRELRESYGITILDLACEIDCSEVTIGRIERGERSGLCTVYKLAKFFNVKIEDLLV